MERIKNLLLEARTDLKDFKEKQKVVMDQLYPKSTADVGADATLLEMVKFINTQVVDTQARVMRLEQELGQTWDVGTKLYANIAATSTPTQDHAATEKAKKREEDMENFRKKVLGYCNGSRGVHDDVEQWKLHLPQIATKAKKYLTEDQFDALHAVATSVEDIKSTRTKLTKWYESTFPTSKRPSGPKESASKTTTTTTTTTVAKPKSSSSAEKTQKVVATPKPAPKPVAKPEPMETSDDDDEGASGDDDEVELVPEAKKKFVPTPTTTTSSASRMISSSEEEKKPKPVVKKSLPKTEELPSSSKKAKVVAAPVATTEDDDISSVASEEEPKSVKKPKKSETKLPKKKD
ncbi:hypothetical protein BASA81_002758 [Batrachochytrium salamandrivorans]|nr:hypothetical protein BASA81_002758 [Batrachochytrium salamandrivorans]